MKKGKQIGFIMLASVAMLALLYTCNKSKHSDQPQDPVKSEDVDSVENNEASTTDTNSSTPPKEVVAESDQEVQEALPNEVVKGKRGQGYYVAPLDGPILLSGTFGELRGNHFHAGLDIRTGGVEGRSIKAAASGYVSRIKVSSRGYGKALYIQHPNGTTTVYGHLKKFSGAIQEAVIAKQYALKKYEFDWYVPAGKLKVTKGQEVAKSGNTGGSGGPHLHFEIRDRRGNTVNPLLYGLQVEDKIPPFVKSAKLYKLDYDRYITHGIFANAPVKKNDTIRVPPGTYGVGVSWVDYFSDKLNRLGINYADIWVNGKKVFSQTIEDFAFSQGRYINKHIDYWTYSERGVRYVKMFKDKGNKLHFYKGNGAIKVGNNSKLRVDIKGYDYIGKSSTLTFYIKGSSSSPELKNGGNAKPGSVKCSPNKSNTLTSQNASVVIPKGSLYNAAYMGITETAATGKSISPMIRVNNAHVPLHKSATIKIKVPEAYASMKDKLVMLSYDKNSRSSSYEGGKIWGNYVVETTKSLGMFYLAVDTIPPKITALSLKRYMSFRVVDLTSNIKSYNAYIDGKWFLLEYEPKSNKLFGNLPKSIPAGNHSVELRVTDGAGNTAIYKKSISI